MPQCCLMFLTSGPAVVGNIPVFVASFRDHGYRQPVVPCSAKPFGPQQNNGRPGQKIDLIVNNENSWNLPASSCIPLEGTTRTFYSFRRPISAVLKLQKGSGREP